MKKKVVHYSTSDFDERGKWLFTTLCGLGDLGKRDKLTFEDTRDKNKVSCKSCLKLINSAHSTYEAQISHLAEDSKV